jgi:hypothetical protein
VLATVVARSVMLTPLRLESRQGMRTREALGTVDGIQRPTKRFRGLVRRQWYQGGLSVVVAVEDRTVPESVTEPLETDGVAGGRGGDETTGSPGRKWFTRSSYAPTAQTPGAESAVGLSPHCGARNLRQGYLVRAPARAPKFRRSDVAPGVAWRVWLATFPPFTCRLPGHPL